MATLPSTIETELRSQLEYGRFPETGNALHTRDRNRGGLLRVAIEPNLPVVVKLWRVRHPMERAKYVSGLSNACREWRMHRYLYRNGVHVAKPVGYTRLTFASGHRWEAMAIEDLGETERGLPYIKRLITEGDEAGILAFEKDLISITSQFVRLGIIDIDHQLNNFLVDYRRRVFRIDFECARHPATAIVFSRERAEMLARFVTTYVYAVQPDGHRVGQFVDRLYAELKPTRRVRFRIARSVTRKLRQQYRMTGMETKLQLPI